MNADSFIICVDPRLSVVVKSQSDWQASDRLILSFRCNEESRHKSDGLNLKFEISNMHLFD